MANESLISIERQALATMFFGTAIAFVIHGVTCCQIVWFFRNQSGRSSKRMVAFVVFVWLTEAVSCAFTFLATLHAFFLPAVIYAANGTIPCSDGIARAISIPETLCTLCVEGFFIMRVWRFSGHKKLAMLLFIPYVASYGFGLALIVRSFRGGCHSDVADVSLPLIYGSYGFAILLDGVIAAAMCYLLYSRSSGFTRHSNTIKIVRGLILYSISSGVLMWIINVLFLLALSGLIPSPASFFYITGGIYVNAMLAQLNARARFRAMADQSMPLNSISLGETVLSEPADRELELVRT